MATVIKAGRVIPSGTSVQHSKFNLEDMSQQASKYLDSVKDKAAQIVKEAQKQAESIKQQATVQGQQAAVAKAEKAALAEMEKRWASLAPALQQAIDKTNQLRAGWIKNWEENIIHLVVGVAERVIRTELAQRPEISQQWIKEALELASGSAAITVQLNPDDFTDLSEHVESIRQQFSQLADAQIVPCAEISSGGCRVLTEYGRIDQQIESQLERIREELSS